MEIAGLLHPHRLAADDDVGWTGTAPRCITKTMIDRVEERFDLKPQHLIGDMVYGAGPMLGWLVDEKQIEPHIIERKSICSLPT